MILLLLARAIAFSCLGFVRMQPMPQDERRDAAFDELLVRALKNKLETIPYTLPYPKHEFLIYVSKSHNYLMHGSPRPDIKLFESREQTTFFGIRVEAVFASSDGIWAMFFAILDRTLLPAYRYGCFTVDKNSMNRNRYFFSVPAGFLRKNPWVDGCVYILPKSGFQQSDIVNEWICSHAVVPLTKLPVAPFDFPFLTSITEYDLVDSGLKFFIKNAIRARLMKMRNWQSAK